MSIRNHLIELARLRTKNNNNKKAHEESTDELLKFFDVQVRADDGVYLFKEHSWGSVAYRVQVIGGKVAVFEELKEIDEIERIDPENPPPPANQIPEDKDIPF